MLKDSKDGLLNVRYAPSIPKENWAVFKDLKPGPHNGSCGNIVYKNEPQYVIDTFNDQRWLNLRDVAKSFQLYSCWSIPIQDETGKAIGSFALSSFEQRKPTNFHTMLLEMGANIVSIVLKNLQNENRINILQDSMQRASEGIIFTDKDNKILEVNKAFEKIYGYKASDVIGHNPSILKSGCTLGNPIEKCGEITKAIASFAKNLDIVCIAEFVHSSEIQKKRKSLA